MQYKNIINDWENIFDSMWIKESNIVLTIVYLFYGLLLFLVLYHYYFYTIALVNL